MSYCCCCYSVLDCLSADNSSGASAYNTDTSAVDSGGSVNAAAPVTTAAADASGGNGSFLGVLQNTLTQGLNDDVISGTDYGLGSLTGLLTGNTEGEAAPESAPTTAANAQGTSTSTLLLYGGIAVGVILVIYLLARR